MLFEKRQDIQNENITNFEELKKYEYKQKYGFLDELRNSVKSDEEYAKFKGYMD